jgi:hypothetical protein
MSGPAFHDPIGPAPETRSVRFAWLLFGVGTAPLFWAGQVMLAYGVSAYVCYPADHPVAPADVDGLRLLLLLFDGIALAGCGAGALVSWRLWRQVKAGRNRFLALWGVLSSLGFLAAVFFNVIASLMVPPCQG